MISIQSLRVDYESVTAVSDLTFEVPAGQIYGLVGPNGAGKTSTLKALAGIIEPTYGEIRIGGCDLQTNPEGALRQLGFMPDFPPIYENLKVWEYLEVFAAAYLIGRARRLELARHWVERVNLADKWDTYVRDLSRGMRQRLILAKTFLHEPRVILLDEPASGLDPLARIDLRNILKEMAAMGKAIIISSHILPELSDFCNAIGVMEKGKMVVSGSIEVIRNTIGAHGELVIRVTEGSLANKEIIYSVLKESPLVTATSEAKDGEFRSIFKGDEKGAAALLAELVSRQVPVSQFFIKHADIEDIFMKIGAKEVS